MKIDLKNYFNLQYSGPAFFGTPMLGNSNSTFIYDTGSPDLTTTSNSCYFGCGLSKYYNPELSSTSSHISNVTKTIKYGSLTLDGNYL